MTRHWQNQESGQVYSTGYGRITTESVRENCIEVKIVPLDAIVIEWSELSEVQVGPGRYITLPSGQGFGCDETPEWYRARAIDFLTASEWVKAHPPVDEAQVSALAEMLPEIDEAYGPLHYARALIATGKVTVEVTP